MGESTDHVHIKLMNQVEHLQHQYLWVEKEICPMYRTLHSLDLGSQKWQEVLGSPSSGLRHESLSLSSFLVYVPGGGSNEPGKAKSQLVIYRRGLLRAVR